MATTHELGQNFAKAFDIFFQSEEGQAELCFTSSWGASTRMVGGLIMLHGDDDGLVVPPRLAPIQAVVIAVRDEPEVNDACDAVAASLKSAGVACADRPRPRQLRSPGHRLGDQGRAAARRSRSPRPQGRSGHAGAARQREPRRHSRSTPSPPTRWRSSARSRRHVQRRQGHGSPTPPRTSLDRRSHRSGRDGFRATRLGHGRVNRAKRR
jgi:hypothetical protein